MKMTSDFNTHMNGSLQQGLKFGQSDGIVNHSKNFITETDERYSTNSPSSFTSAKTLTSNMFNSCDGNFQDHHQTHTTELDCSDDDDDQAECPLCLDTLELDDLNFYPCSCGYQICRFCWNKIRTEGSGLCPACRSAYSEDPANFKPLSVEDVARIKAKKKAKEVAKKAKVSESRKHLANVRVVQRNLVFVVGLSTRLADAEVLKKTEYFAKFGKIHKVVVNHSTSYAGVQSQGPSSSAYVTYYRFEDALRAIQAVTNVVIDGRALKASLGTTKYCAHFMKNQSCPKHDCMYLHELGDEAASFTKEEMQQGKHTEYERTLHEALLVVEPDQQQSGSANSSSCKQLSTIPTVISQANGGCVKDSSPLTKRSSPAQQHLPVSCSSSVANPSSSSRISPFEHEQGGSESAAGDVDSTLTRQNGLLSNGSSVRSDSPTSNSSLNNQSVSNRRKKSSSSSMKIEEKNNNKSLMVNKANGESEWMDDRNMNEILNKNGEGCSNGVSSFPPPPPLSLESRSCGGDATQTTEISENQKDFEKLEEKQKIKDECMLRVDEREKAAVVDTIDDDIDIDLDDSLGFDPFHETQKALADLLEHEAKMFQQQQETVSTTSSTSLFQQFNSSSNGTNSSPSNNRLKPPPGFGMSSNGGVTMNTAADVNISKVISSNNGHTHTSNQTFDELQKQLLQNFSNSGNSLYTNGGGNRVYGGSGNGLQNWFLSSQNDSTNLLSMPKNGSSYASFNGNGNIHHQNGGVESSVHSFNNETTITDNPRRLKQLEGGLRSASMLPSLATSSSSQENEINHQLPTFTSNGGVMCSSENGNYSQQNSISINSSSNIGWSSFKDGGLSRMDWTTAGDFSNNATSSKFILNNNIQGISSSTSNVNNSLLLGSNSSSWEMHSLVNQQQHNLNQGSYPPPPGFKTMANF